MTIAKVCSVCDIAELEKRPREFMGKRVEFVHCPICDVRRCARATCKRPLPDRVATCTACGCDVT